MSNTHILSILTTREPADGNPADSELVVCECFVPRKDLVAITSRLVRLSCWLNSMNRGLEQHQGLKETRCADGKPHGELCTGGYEPSLSPQEQNKHRRRTSEPGNTRELRARTRVFVLSAPIIPDSKELIRPQTTRDITNNLAAAREIYSGDIWRNRQ